FVSINGEHEIDPALVHRKIPYTHPLFSLEAIAAQKELPALNRRGNGQSVFFAGSYFRYGFHEDAFASAVHLSRLLRPQPVFPGIPGDLEADHPWDSHARTAGELEVLLAAPQAKQT
ncbi:MAG: hypothetical protein ACKPGK_15130, partial [Verrucomicrobiota bacterium]